MINSYNIYDIKFKTRKCCFCFLKPRVSYKMLLENQMWKLRRQNKRIFKQQSLVQSVIILVVIIKRYEWRGHSWYDERDPYTHIRYMRTFITKQLWEWLETFAHFPLKGTKTRSLVTICFVYFRFSISVISHCCAASQWAQHSSDQVRNECVHLAGQTLSVHMGPQLWVSLLDESPIPL